MTPRQKSLHATNTFLRNESPNFIFSNFSLSLFFPFSSKQDTVVNVYTLSDGAQLAKPNRQIKERERALTSDRRTDPCIRPAEPGWTDGQTSSSD